MGNQELTIQRHWQHWVQKTRDKQTEEKTEGAIRNGRPRDTGNIGYKRQGTDKRWKKTRGQ